MDEEIKVKRDRKVNFTKLIIDNFEYCCLKQREKKRKKYTDVFVIDAFKTFASSIVKYAL